MDKLNLIRMILSDDEGSITLTHRYSKEKEIIWVIRALVLDPAFLYAERFHLFKERGAWHFEAWSDETGTSYDDFPAELYKMDLVAFRPKTFVHPQIGECIHSVGGFTNKEGVKVKDFCYKGEGKFLGSDGKSWTFSTTEIERMVVESFGSADGFI